MKKGSKIRALTHIALLGSAVLAVSCALAAPAGAQGVVSQASPVVAAPSPAPTAKPKAPAKPAPAFAVPARIEIPVIRGYYIVKRGGSLAAVAKATGTRLADLKRLNPHIPTTVRLGPGSWVALPKPG